MMGLGMRQRYHDGVHIIGHLNLLDSRRDHKGKLYFTLGKKREVCAKFLDLKSRLSIVRAAAEMSTIVVDNGIGTMEVMPVLSPQPQVALLRHPFSPPEQYRSTDF